MHGNFLPAKTCIGLEPNSHSQHFYVVTNNSLRVVTNNSLREGSPKKKSIFKDIVLIYLDPLPPPNQDIKNKDSLFLTMFTDGKSPIKNFASFKNLYSIFI